jgi:hypothetical protein
MLQYDMCRERFLESNDNFRQDMFAAIRKLRKDVAVFFDLLSGVEAREDQLQESIDELKRVVLDHGEQIRVLGEEIRGLGNRLQG